MGGAVYRLNIGLASKEFRIVALAPDHATARRYERLGEIDVRRFVYFLPRRFERLAYDGGILPNLKRGRVLWIQVPLLFVAFLLAALRLSLTRIHAVHSYWIIPSGIVGAVLHRFRRIPHVITCLGGDVGVLRGSRWGKLVLMFVLRNADEIVCVSSNLLKHLLEEVPAELRYALLPKSHVIPMGIDVSRYDFPRRNLTENSSRKSTILFLGRLVEKKGIPTLLSAMRDVRLQFQDCRLMICGGGPMRAELESAVDRLGIRDNVFFTGPVSDEEKGALLAKADILVVPSESTEYGDIEGLPVVILEGLAAGKPVVASNVGGVSDAIVSGFNGILVSEKRPDQLAQAIVSLLGDVDVRSRLSKQARSTASMFDWDAIIESYYQVLMMAIQGNQKY